MASVTPREGYGYQVRYIDPSTGKRPSRTFKLKKEAEAFRRKVEREIEDGTHTAASETRTVATVADEYLDQLDQRLKDGRIGRSHYIRETRVVTKHIVPHFGQKPVRNLQPVDVDKFYRHLSSTGKLAPMTAKAYLYTLQYLERFARRRGYLKTQPITDGLADLKGIRAERIRTFAESDVRALLAAVEAHRHGQTARSERLWACMVYLAAFCGLRQGEILGLTTDHVDLDRGIIRVRHNLALGDILKGPKTAAGVRDLRLPERAAYHLRAYLADHFEPNERRLIFRAKGGGPLLASNLHRPWRRLLKAAGLASGDKQFHFHALRHFHASWLIANGLPVTDVSALLGHSHFDQTLQVYAHPVMKEAQRHDRLDAIAGLLTTHP